MNRFKMKFLTTTVAAFVAAFSFGSGSAEAHSPAGYCAKNPTHDDCLFDDPPDDPPSYTAAIFEAPFVDMTTALEVGGKAWMTSEGYYLVDTVGLEPSNCETDFDGVIYCAFIYDICLAGFTVEVNLADGSIVVSEFTQNLNDNDVADEFGNLNHGGRLSGLAGKTIVQLSFQIFSDTTGQDHCDNVFDPKHDFHDDHSVGIIVQESGLAG